MADKEPCSDFTMYMKHSFVWIVAKFIGKNVH